MGVFDTLIDSERNINAQVKCFNSRMAEYCVGDTISDFPGSCSIWTIEVSWANIQNGVFVGFSDEPLSEVHIDKWGGSLA